MANLILEFYPYSFDYIINKKGDCVFRAFGLTAEGKKIVVMDSSFKPYFYVAIKKDYSLKALKEISEIEVQDEERTVKPLNATPVTRILNGKKTFALKIEVKQPRDISLIGEQIRNIEGYIGKIETNIPFVKRYLVDNKLTPLSRWKVSGKQVEHNIKNIDYIVQANEIEEVELESGGHPKILVFDIETYNPIGKSRPEKDPIIMISFADNKNFKKVLCWKRFENAPDYVEFVNSEMELIERFVEILKDENPTIIAGYNSDNFDFPYILTRAKKYKIPIDFGFDGAPLKVSKRGVGMNAKAKGIVHIDIYNFIRNILSPSLKTEVYDLNSVAKEIINEKKYENLKIEELHEIWDKNKNKLRTVAEYNLTDSIITLKLVEKIMPIIFELTKLIGQPLYDISRMTYGQYVEWYLIRNASNYGQFIPDRPMGNVFKNRLTKTYVGAYVHEPKPGLYDNIVVFDFRSLYPSIIISHNIGPTTIEHKNNEILFEKDRKGFIPSIIEELVSRRSRIKEILKTINKNDKDYTILSSRSYALKTVANAIYGYLGFPRSRWYCLECAAKITELGRNYIKDVIAKALKEKFEVLYADSITKDRFVTIMDKKGFVQIKNIEELFEENIKGTRKLGKKEVIQLKGYKALTISPKTKTAKWSKINAVVRHKTSKKIFRVNQKNGETVITKDHSLITKFKEEYIPTKPEELSGRKISAIETLPKLKQITKIDVYKILNNHKTNKSVRIKKTVKVGTKEFASMCRLLGAYITKGRLTASKSNERIEIISTNLNWLKRVKKGYRLFFNAKSPEIHSQKSKKNSLYKLEIKDKTAIAFFKAFCEHKNFGKKIPEFIFHIPSYYKTMLLTGDSRKNIKNLSIETSSLQLISGITTILKQLGKKYSLRHSNSKQKYRLKVCQKSNNKLTSKVSNEHYKGYVYDLNVEGTHMFVDSCGQILLHNTDSLFLTLKKGDKNRALAFLKKLNKDFPGVMELDLQGVYPRGIFVSKKSDIEKGAKKKYALLDEKGNVVVKGLEYVRRDWSKIAKYAQMQVLNAVLKDNSKEKAFEIIKDIINKLRQQEVPVEDVAMYKQLTRKIKDYESIGPHVAAAKKALVNGIKFEPGQTIQYIISKNEGSISDRAYTIDEFKKKGLQYDDDYYINNQVIPAVQKIFEVLGYSKEELIGKIQMTLEGFFK